MNSSRFHGKPMKKINGVPMIEIVYRNAVKVKELDQVYVATCDKEIYDHVVSVGGNAIYTSNKHERASERTAEALLKIEKKNKKKYDIVVMIQGDEPMIKPHMVKKSVKPFFKSKNINVVNLMSKVASEKEFYDLNEPKVVVNNKNEAIYFSRCPIPSNWKEKSQKLYKQVCVIPFKRQALLKFNRTKTTFLERMESIDMNRIIETGEKIQMVEIKEFVKSVDTIADLKIVEKSMSSFQRK